MLLNLILLFTYILTPSMRENTLKKIILTKFNEALEQTDVNQHFEDISDELAIPKFSSV